MMPLVEQIYFTLLKGGSSRTIHISLRNEIIGFLKEYRITKGFISTKNPSGCYIKLYKDE
jgi:hypothetical protein